MTSSLTVVGKWSRHMCGCIHEIFLANTAACWKPKGAWKVLKQ
jgi:hypothetical protein